MLTTILRMGWIRLISLTLQVEPHRFRAERRIQRLSYTMLYMVDHIEHETAVEVWLAALMMKLSSLAGKEKKPPVYSYRPTSMSASVHL